MTLRVPLLKMKANYNADASKVTHDSPVKRHLRSDVFLDNHMC